jgi:hypothetical protein
MIKEWLLALIVTFGLGGCAGLTQFPEVTKNYDVALRDLDADYATTLDRIYGKNVVAAAEAKQIRSEMMERRMAVIDANFKDFQAGLVKENVRAEFGIALLGIAVGAAGSQVAETASQILSAVSGGLAGAQAAYGKAVLYDKAMSALLAQMQAGRKAVAAQIFERWNQDLDQYPMWMARTDLEAYYFAGSLPGAILGTAADAKVKNDDAEDRLAKFRVTKFSEDKSGNKIQAFIRPPDGKPTDTLNTVNRDKVRKWIDEQSTIKDLPLASFISNAGLKELRERAIREIPIP